MASVETVNGRIDVDELGLTLIHEHFFSCDEAVSAQWPHVREREQERDLAVEVATAVKGMASGRWSSRPRCCSGRDVATLQRLAAETGLQIVACTGIYTYDHLPQFLINRSEDFIAELFVHDIEEGIQGTEIKAAFIKCAADEPGVNERIEKVHRAAARASLKTGVPVMAHSRPASPPARARSRSSSRRGSRPRQIQIAHTGDTDELPYIEGLLEKGVYIGMDRYGIDLFLATDAQRHPARAPAPRLRRADVPLARTSTSRSQPGSTGIRPR